MFLLESRKNENIIQCECGNVITHKDSKKLVDCPNCGRGQNLKYIKEHKLVQVDKRPTGHDSRGGIS